mmetsp:Transcript_23028/g.50220  ORF Transcript_23028/g.50220 Transcript_23028/m.50220 type:complete len:102 (-) Transcript_23028:4287-4592(-)
MKFTGVIAACVVVGTQAASLRSLADCPSCDVLIDDIGKFSSITEGCKAAEPFASCSTTLETICAGPPKKDPCQKGNFLVKPLCNKYKTEAFSELYKTAGCK